MRIDNNESARKVYRLYIILKVMTTGRRKQR